MVARVDDTGAAHAGSQRQTQLWVNQHPEALHRELGRALPEIADARIEWRSPVASERYREYRDRAFLERVGLGEHAEALREFWPRGGPVWDALATVEFGDRRAPGVLLVEGKSYPGELYASGCQAVPGSPSRRLIERSLAETQRWLGLVEEGERWCGPLYQNANRLAHLCWLREVVGVDAWLVHLLFVGDPRTPTTHEEWTAALAAADDELGLAGPVPGAEHVRLSAEPLGAPSSR